MASPELPLHWGVHNEGSDHWFWWHLQQYQNVWKSILNFISLKDLYLFDEDSL